jgi:hypothetical protein
MLKQIATAITIANKSRVLLPRIKSLGLKTGPRPSEGTRAASNAHTCRMRVLIASAYTNISQFSECHCGRPMAPALPLCRTETSVRRRFLSSPRTSHSSPVAVYVGCRMQSTIAGREIRRRGFGASPPPEKPNDSRPIWVGSSQDFCCG